VFGTALTTTVSRGGTIRRDPDSPRYPWGSVVRLTALPAAGSRFAQWGRAASGTANPLEFRVAAAQPTVSAHFTLLAAGERAVVVASEGFGQVRVDPAANHYAPGTQVTLTAWPDAGQLFKGWGDAADVQNPLVLTVGGSQSLLAVFTKRPALEVQTSGGGRTAAGLQLTVRGEFGGQYRIEESADLVMWQTAATLAAPYGLVQYRTPLPPSEEVKAYRAVVVPSGPPLNPDPAELVWVPPGTFLMGSPVTEHGRLEDEGPQTRVSLTKGFWLAQREVTQRQYVALMGFNPSVFRDDLERPVEQVSWYDAMEYCARLNQRERAAGRLPAGYEYGLPTEAQREYACRAGTTTAYPFGTDTPAGHLDRHAWFWDNSGSRPGQDIITHPVGQKAPSAWGFHDILGNVWEWCADRYGSYPGGSQVDWKGAASGIYRVARGGSAWHSSSECRSAARHHHLVDNRSGHVGFRVALVPVP